MKTHSIHSLCIRRQHIAPALGILLLAGRLALSQSTPASGSAIVAQVAGAPITQAEVDASLGREGLLLKQKLYSLRKAALDSLIDSKLIAAEAARQGLSEPELLDRQIQNVPAPSPIQIEKEWVNNYESISAMEESVARYRVKLDLESHARTEALQAYIAKLRAANRVNVFLQPPDTRLQFRPGNNVIGGPSAVTDVVVFSDYECPYCHQLNAELEELLKDSEFRSNIRVTFKNFPLPMHHGAFPAAVASVCARNQHKFPAMHSLLAAAQTHTSADLTAAARSAGLDQTAFQACLSSNESQLEVLSDMQEGKEVGVQGTPTLYVDGKLLETPGSVQELRSALLPGSGQSGNQTASNSEINQIFNKGVN